MIKILAYFIRAELSKIKEPTKEYTKKLIEYKIVQSRSDQNKLIEDLQIANLSACFPKRLQGAALHLFLQSNKCKIGILRNLE